MPSNPMPRALAVALILMIATAFAANHVAARLAFDHGVDVVTAIVFRSAATALAVLALMLAQGVPLRLPAATARRASLIGLILVVQSYCLYSSVARIPVALALLVFNTYPLLLSLISWLAGAERPTRRTLAVMPVALVGLALALDAGGWSSGRAGFGGRWSEIGAGVGFGLGAGASFALALFLTTRWLKEVDGRMRALVTMAVVAVVACVGPLTGQGFALPVDATGWLGLVLLAAFYGLAFTSLFVLLPRIGAVNNVALMNFEPIAALAMGWLILGQSVASLQLVGALIVIGAIVALAAARR